MYSMVTGDSAQNQDVLNTIDAIKLKGSGFPEIFSTPWQRNYASDPRKFWRCKHMLEVLYHHAKFRGARISPTAGVAKNVDFFVCLSVSLLVCLSVTLLNIRVCAHDFAMKALEYRNGLDTVG